MKAGESVAEPRVILKLLGRTSCPYPSYRVTLSDGHDLGRISPAGTGRWQAFVRGKQGVGQPGTQQEAIAALLAALRERQAQSRRRRLDQIERWLARRGFEDDGRLARARGRRTTPSDLTRHRPVGSLDETRDAPCELG